MTENTKRMLARFQSAGLSMMRKVVNDNATNDNGPDDGGSDPGAYGLLKS